MTVLTGVCEEAFGLELGYTQYKDIVYEFENNSMQWTGWDGDPPLRTTEESLCGRHSLFVSN